MPQKTLITKPLDIQHILDHALVLAEHSSWENLQLTALANSLNFSVVQLARLVKQKDELADAWFDRADEAMLSTELAGADTAADKLELAIRSWLNALVPYPRLTRQMLYYKLEPGHVHLQAAALLRISRTVQWLRELTGLKASGSARVTQELALSGLFVSIFIGWLHDTSPAQTASLKRLKFALATLNKLGLCR
ncbi:TetR family transcriptional regulator [Arsukibacterium sp. MJ3]|uniref:TetR family transcriptional regulator n=1 Tax=Arsukibacterium sp. MJ3 TaxID=1632859 RepID=UPI0006273B13|nr:TetR family transcriptional regulator [Arsukibacterium sp. MJ3]KKO47587.1 TetR family transcriptional regulator [Arsukibacterium sp. MJ3]